MKCENCFCIYEFNEECLLEEIAIDISGRCTDCIYPEIDKNVLDEAKSTLLDKYENFDM